MSRAGKMAVAAATTKLWWRLACYTMCPQQSLPAVAGEPSLDNQLSTMPGLPLPLKLYSIFERFVGNQAFTIAIAGSNISAPGAHASIISEVSARGLALTLPERSDVDLLREFRRVSFPLASRSFARRLLGEREALSLFPAFCAFLSVVSTSAVSHERQLSPACRAVAMGRNRGRGLRCCCRRGVRSGTCGAAS
jgi:hypothetical protein